MSSGRGPVSEAVAPSETVPGRHRLRTRLTAVVALTGAVLLATGGVGLHYVDEVAETLRLSTDVTGPLLSQVLEITHEGRRARTSIHAAAEQCVGVEAARAEIAAFRTTTTRGIADVSERAATVGATDDLARIAETEERFVAIGEAVLDTCSRDSVILGRMTGDADALAADLRDAWEIVGAIESGFTAGLRDGDGRSHALGPSMAGTLPPDLGRLARIRSELATFTGFAETLAALTTPAAIDDFEKRRLVRQRDLVSEVRALGPLLAAAGRAEDHERLSDLVGDLGLRAFGDRGLLRAQRARLATREIQAERRLALGVVDDDYFRAVRALEATARRLDEAARGRVASSTSEAYAAVATTSTVLLLLTLALAIDLGRRITGPLDRFTRHVERMRALDEFDTPLPSGLLRRNDEFGVLARAFSALVVEVGHAHRRLEAETRSQISRQYDRLQAAIATMPQAFFLVDAEERIVVWNDAFLHMYDLRPGELMVGAPVAAVMAHCAAAGATPIEPNDPLFRRAMRDGRSHQAVLDYVDGRIVAITASPTADGGAAVTHEDLTARKRAEEEMEHLVHFDAATGLPNRASLRERLAEALRERRDHQVALIHVDLDHFKTINDSLGHSIGDRLLACVAERIAGELCETECVGRLGGDEFGVIQAGATQPGAAADLARRLDAVIARPYDIDGTRIVMRASFGVAVAPDDAVEVEALFAHADLALHRAKSDGRGATRFYQPGMDAAVAARRSLEADLALAIERGEFEVHYQPLVGAVSNRIEGFEALLRWRHPTRGLVAPSDFVPLAEETGRIVEIGAWVLEEATRAAARWPRPLRVAVNISPVQLARRTLGLDVVGALARSGLAAGRLELEVTEGIFLGDTEATLAAMAELRDVGVRFSMDDFGTGYSSLGYLRRFAFDKVKIDQSFVRDLGETADSVAIVRAVTSLCSSLGITTVAEGVETAAQWERLLIEGCDQFQGWLFGRPVPESQIAALLEADADRAAPPAGRRRDRA